MPTLYCSRCSRVISFDGAPPQSCPDCGFTFDNAADSTNTHDRGRGLVTTIMDALSAPAAHLGRYQIKSELGKGAFGAVYLAYDPALKRDVAIKVPLPRWRDNKTVLERFAREGRNAAQLRHPGIVSVYTVEEDYGLPFIVSDYIDGETLGSQLKRERPSFRTAASLVAAIAAAVDFAHCKGIIHRDIKPGNIMIDPLGNPRLMDFGLAKQEESDPTLTIPDQVLGTPAYMSPEQARGTQSEINSRTDIYSLGALLYFLLTRTLPFQGTTHAVLDQVKRDEPRRPRVIDKTIPIDLETICLKAMAKNADNRYKTARELSEDLERWLRGEPILARHISPAERAWRWCRRHPAPAALILSIALLLLVSAGGAFAYAGAATKAKDIAEEGRKEAVAARRREEELRTAEAEARQQAEIALRENRKLLSRAYIDRGARYVGVAEFSDDHNPLMALPWMAAAMKVDAGDPDRLLADRIRLQLQLDCAPRIERLWHFKEKVGSTGVSRNHDLFFVAGQDGMVNVWKTERAGAPIATFSHASQVFVAAFSPDGKLLATAATDGVRVWEIATSKLVRGPLALPAKRNITQRPSADAAPWVAFSRSGQLLVSRTEKGCQIWKVDTGEPQSATIEVEDPGTANAEFVDVDRLLVVWSNGRPTRVYDVDTGKLMRKLPNLESGREQFSYAFVSPDGTTVANTFASGKILLWNAVTGETIGEPLIPEVPVPCRTVTFASDGQRLATGSLDGTVRVWNKSDGRLLWSRQVNFEIVQELRFSPDDSMLAVGGPRKKISVLSVAGGRMLAEPIELSSLLYSVSWANGSRGLLVFTKGLVRLWEFESRVSTTRIPQVVRVGRAAVSADRRVLAIAEPQNSVWIVRIGLDGRCQSEKPLAFSIGNDVSIDAIALSHDGTQLAVSGERNVSVLDTVHHTPPVGPLEHSDRVTVMRFTADGAVLVCLSFDGRATVWDIATSRRLYEPLDISRNIFDIDIDVEGKRCAVAAMSGVTIWELRSGQRLRPGFLGDAFPRFVRFLKDPNGLLVAQEYGPIRTWDLATGKPVHSIDYSAALQSIDISADRGAILAAISDGSVRLWSAQDATPASRPLEHPSSVQRAVIDPTGRWIIATTTDWQVFVWDARTGEIVGVMSLRHLARGLETHHLESDTPPSPVLSFFSADGRRAHVITQQGMVATINLVSDDRSPKRLIEEAAIETSAEFDGAGGLRIFDPPETARRWESANWPSGPLTRQSRGPRSTATSDAERVPQRELQLSKP